MFVRQIEDYAPRWRAASAGSQSRLPERAELAKELSSQYKVLEKMDDDHYHVYPGSWGDHHISDHCTKQGQVDIHVPFMFAGSDLRAKFGKADGKKSILSVENQDGETVYTKASFPAHRWNKQAIEVFQVTHMRNGMIIAEELKLQPGQERPETVDFSCRYDKNFPTERFEALKQECKNLPGGVKV